jgi:glycosyltransferase involved in cell wall biosynthesis
VALNMAERSSLEVSVVIPVYRAGRMVEQAVESALALPDVREVILVEDGSPDESWAVCKALAASCDRVKVLQHPGGINRGAGASRNLGISACTSPFVAFLDADDYFLPNRFEEDRRVLQAHPDAHGAYGAIGTAFDQESMRAAFMAQFGSDLTTVRDRVPPEELFSALLGAKRGFGHFSIDGLTVKRQVLMAMQPCFPEELRLHQDTVFLFRLAHRARLHAGSIASPVAMRRVHALNRITDQSQQARNRRLMYDHLWAWARTAGLSADDRRRLEARRLYWTLRDSPGRAAAWRALPAFLARPWLWRWVKVREELLTRLLGAENPLNKALKALAWRVLGDGGSYL